MEAVLSSALGREERAKLLVLSNGSYAERIAAIAAQAGFRHSVLRLPETEPLSPAKAREWLHANGSEITLVAFVHCETSTGIINPMKELVEAVRSVSGMTSLEHPQCSQWSGGV